MQSFRTVKYLNVCISIHSRLDTCVIIIAISSCSGCDASYLKGEADSRTSRSLCSLLELLRVLQKYLLTLQLDLTVLTLDERLLTKAKFRNRCLI